MRIIPLDRRDIGLRGYLVIDSTRLGPAFGGVRVADYADADACLGDAKRLAAAMTQKCAFHEIPGGGGKAAIVAGEIRDRGAVMHAIGEVVESLDGDFFTGPDTGINRADIDAIRGATRFVSVEDVTDATARGILAAIRAAFAHRSRPLRGATVAVQGFGAVGLRLAVALSEEGANVRGHDTSTAARENARRAGLRVVDGETLLAEPCDLYCPCALGGVIDARVAEAISCGVIAGAANNALTDPALAGRLHRRGIVFVPDFVANGGGVIRGAWVHLRGTPGTNNEIDAISGRVTRLLDAAAERDLPPLAVALEWVRARLTA